MKRTALRRGKSRLKRTRLRPRGARAEREEGDLEHFREVVLARGCCERCGAPGTDPHHMVTNPRAHIPSLGALLCRACHRGIHDHTLPDWRGWFA